ncbi:alpha-amlyase [Methanoculleus sp. FWC-SCC1]|uniref:Alpha-amlyase n=1 Tax=Methanoculleus frigidifontis TaxID=2584085 RepID=A0ABT8ME56_9EURY|nr:alpha-amylase [Methanoculleus sp. FWC-SCC1]MDN7026229.1 alpha-amlyase [Methanoculleus sp. FWC-SCC1]
MTDGGRRGMRICFGFGVHHPYLLNRAFHPDDARGRKHLTEAYFSSRTRDAFLRAVNDAYLPTLAALDGWRERGVACTFSISGPAVEHLERWAPDALDLLRRVVSAPGTELLAQTYYHGIAERLGDACEVEEQVVQHRRLMEETFGKRPAIYDATDFAFSRDVAETVRRAGLAGIYIEGNERVLAGRNPNCIYRSEGLPVLVRHCPLSDDVARRFFMQHWDQYPLTPGKYAGWIAASPGDCVHASIDLGVLRQGDGTGPDILGFIRDLPDALEQAGVAATVPSEIIAAASEGDAIWDGKEDARHLNMMQQSAVDALQSGGRWLPEKQIWRLLQEVDHFHAMAMKSGSCGEAFHQASQEEAFSAFDTYMRILSDYEERSAAMVRSKRAALSLRCVPPEKAFHFSSPDRTAGFAAHSLEELADMLEYASDEVIAYHRERGDFTRWITEVIGDTVIGRTVQECESRDELRAALQARIHALWNRLR